MVILVIGTSLRRCSSHHPTPLAHSQSYLRVDIATARMEDSRVEEEVAVAPGIIVTGGQRGPGPGQHTPSGSREGIMYPGPLQMVCTSSEESTVGVEEHQNLLRRTAVSLKYIDSFSTLILLKNPFSI